MSDGKPAGRRSAIASPSMRDPTADAPPANVRPRIVAGAVDLAVIAAAVAWVSQPYPPLLPLMVFIAYHTLCIWFLGRTMGKALLGLRVTGPHGELTLWRSLARAGPGYLLMVLTVGLGWLTAAFDSRRRPLHDLVLGTDVVREADVDWAIGSLVDRLRGFAQEHKEAAARKKGSVAVLGVLWGWLAGLGDAVRRVLRWLRGTSQASSGPSVVGALSSDVAALLSLGVVAVAGAAITVVPPLRGAGEWLVTDRYWYGTGAEVAAAQVDPEDLRSAAERWAREHFGDDGLSVGFCRDARDVAAEMAVELDDPDAAGRIMQEVLGPSGWCISEGGPSPDSSGDLLVVLATADSDTLLAFGLYSGVSCVELRVSTPPNEVEVTDFAGCPDG